MRILIDARLLTRGAISGIEEYTRSIVTEMLKNHPEHTYGFFWNGIKKIDFPTEWRQKNVECINWSIPNRALDICMHLFGWPKIDSFWDADVIWSPHFLYLPKTKKAKRVITFHDLSPTHFKEFYPFRKQFWHWQQSYQKQAERADHIVTVSEFARNDIADTFNIPLSKITAIHSGVNSFYKKIDNGGQNLKLFKEANSLSAPFFLFLGTLEPRKNIEGIIRAFNIVKTKPGCEAFELVIAGKRGWLYKTILNEVKKSPFSSSIRFWNEPTYDELLYLYNSASAFVWPSFFEGFGHPPLEAQACGTPVIASNRSSLPEVLSDSALLVSPYNCEELAIAMEAVMLQNNIREELTKRGYKNHKRFSWNKSAEALLEVLQTTQQCQKKENQ